MCKLLREIVTLGHPRDSADNTPQQTPGPVAIPDDIACGIMRSLGLAVNSMMRTARVLCAAGCIELI